MAQMKPIVMVSFFFADGGGGTQSQNLLMAVAVARLSRNWKMQLLEAIAFLVFVV